MRHLGHLIAQTSHPQWIGEGRTLPNGIHFELQTRFFLMNEIEAPIVEERLAKHDCQFDGVHADPCSRCDHQPVTRGEDGQDRTGSVDWFVDDNKHAARNDEDEVRIQRCLLREASSGLYGKVAFKLINIELAGLIHDTRCGVSLRSRAMGLDQLDVWYCGSSFKCDAHLRLVSIGDAHVKQLREVVPAVLSPGFAERGHRQFRERRFVSVRGEVYGQDLGKPSTCKCGLSNMQPSLRKRKPSCHASLAGCSHIAPFHKPSPKRVFLEYNSLHLQDTTIPFSR